SSCRRSPSSFTSSRSDPPADRPTRSVKSSLNCALPSRLKSIAQRAPSSFTVTFCRPLLSWIEVELWSSASGQAWKIGDVAAEAAFVSADAAVVKLRQTTMLAYHQPGVRGTKRSKVLMTPPGDPKGIVWADSATAVLPPGPSEMTAFTRPRV